MRIELKNRAHLFVYLALSIAILFTLLGPGYVLTLDMVFGPNARIDPHGLQGPTIGGGLLFSGSILLFSHGMSTQLVQKLLLVLVFFLSGVSAHSMVNTKSQVPKYFAGLLYMVNPFIYVRFLAGHLGILMAYALIPFAIRAFMGMLEGPNKRNFLATLLLLALLSISPHILVLTLFAFLILFIFKAFEVKLKVKKIIPPILALALVFLALNAYWVIPLATAKETTLQQVTEQDLFVFAPRGEGFCVPYSLATMYGFWRGGYTYTKDIFPAWHLFFIVILFLAVNGFISNYRDRRAQSFAAIGLISFFLAMGALGPLKPLFESVGILRGFRDSQKFVGLLVLSYAYLGAMGVEDLRRSVSGSKVKGRKLIGSTLVCLALLTPFAYNFTQFGFWGQLQSTDYPADWYGANEFLNADPQDFNVLFLPWHLYMDFRFVPNQDKRIANPAGVFFDKPIIRGYNLEVPGIYTQSTNPGQQYVQSVLSSGSISGENLRLLNVKYVMLAKEVDYAWYLEMLNNSDLEPVFDSENLVLYRNPERVSRFYGGDEISPEALEPLEYEVISPVEYEAVGGAERYTVFVPPNLDSSDWVLDGREAPEGFYAAWEGQGGNVEYTRFRVYEASYIISISSAVAIAVICLVLWKREFLWGKAGGIVRRLFRLGHSC